MQRSFASIPLTRLLKMDSIFVRLLDAIILAPYVFLGIMLCFVFREPLGDQVRCVFLVLLSWARSIFGSAR